MNDCFYIWTGICKECTKCSKYVSIDGKEGSKLLEEYSNEVSEALKPVEDRWQEKFDSIQVINTMVGNRIKMLNNGSCYDTYTDFFKEHNLEYLLPRYKDGHVIPEKETYLVLV